MKITLIAGTNRAGSTTLKLSKILQRRYDALDGVSTELVDLASLPVEMYSPTAYAEKPQAMSDAGDQVLASDGLVVVSPEYNGSFPGALKLFIDMLPFPESFEKRPVAFVGLAAGGWGGLRPIEHLQGVFGYRNAHIFPDRIFLPKVHQSFDFEAGRCVDDFTEGLLELQITGFVDFVKKLRA